MQTRTKETQEAQREIKALRQDKRKSEYLERESAQLRDKYDELKSNSERFEKAAYELFMAHKTLTQQVHALGMQAAEKGVNRPDYV